MSNEAIAFVLPYDRYKGKTLGEVLASDRSYVEWLARQMTPRTEQGQTIQAMARAVLEATAVTVAAGATAPAEAGNGNSGNGAHSGVTAKSVNVRPANGKPSNGQAARSRTATPAPESGQTPPRATPAPAGDGSDPARVRVYSEITRTAILHVEDALDIGKLRLFLIAYQRGQGASATVAHFLDVEDARVLAADLASGRLPDKFVDYKGSPHGPNGKPLSRVLKVEDRGDDQRAPLVLQVANGPGQVIGEGAIKPDGKPDVEIAILLTRWQARRLGHALQAYLLAWQVGAHRRSNV